MVEKYVHYYIILSYLKYLYVQVHMHTHLSVRVIYLLYNFILNLKLLFYVHLTVHETFMFIIVLLFIKYIKTICKNYFSCMIMTICN